MKIRCIMSGLNYPTYNGRFYSEECLKKAFERIKDNLPIVLECGEVIGFGKAELKYPEIHVEGETVPVGEQLIPALVGSGGIVINGLGKTSADGVVTDYTIRSLLATAHPAISCSIEIVSE